MQPPKNVTLVDAKYHSNYKYHFTFSNGVESIVNFKPIIIYGDCTRHLLDITKFKKMKFNDRGDIYWGKDWDMCFRIHSYYGETKVLPILKSTAKGYAKKIGLDKLLA